MEMNGKVRIERGNKIKERAEREQPLGKQVEEKEEEGEFDMTNGEIGNVRTEEKRVS